MEVTVPDQLAALAHPKRLDVFRLLMRRFPDAVPAGEIASALGLRANTASVYLSALRRADLISQSRHGTFQLYRVRIEVVRDMFGDLLSDCCRNRPDICMPWPEPSGAAPGTKGAPTRVLFLCRQNSARSIMAEALLRARGDRFDVHSAGPAPAASPDPLALRVLADHGIAANGLASSPVDTYRAPTAAAMDLVITVCDHAANEDDGPWPGTPLHAHWSVPDPVDKADPGERLAAMRRTFDVLNEKISALASRPLDGCDRSDLQRQLDDIGRLHRPDTPLSRAIPRAADV